MLSVLQAKISELHHTIHEAQRLLGAAEDQLVSHKTALQKSEEQLATYRTANQDLEAQLQTSRAETQEAYAKSESTASHLQAVQEHVNRVLVIPS